ncbi:histidine phosphatase family protein [Octadecabacter sp. R77987]|uniref:histidine phosphatase family protein n=1 Tax=Octadecabacter sp. R77987 TaxID=3093874 RepID=UPI0036717F59
MTRVFWVRHGPTHEKAFVGHRDVPADLSDTAQIARIDTYLPVDALIVSSDLSRAVDTANAIQNARTRLPHSSDLREFDFGDWDGLHHSEVAARDPDLVRQFWENPGKLAAPNGESWNMVATRVNAAIDGIAAENPRRDIIAVAHIGVIMTQIQRAGGCTAYHAMSHQIANFSITEIQMWPTMGVARINHLP